MIYNGIRYKMPDTDKVTWHRPQQIFDKLGVAIGVLESMHSKGLVRATHIGRMRGRHIYYCAEDVSDVLEDRAFKRPFTPYDARPEFPKSPPVDRVRGRR